MWAITAYFNPMRWQRRRDNFRRFRDALRIPLVAVELSFDGEFEHARGDADVLVQLRGRDVMWQKERLLNCALRALPAGGGAVAWLDCDVVFERPGWAEETERALERAALVQLFDEVAYDGSGAPGGVTHRRPSLMSGVASGLAPLECLTHPSPAQRPGTYAPGIAWAARRDILERHGLFDANVIGGGDRAIASAALGCAGHVLEWHRLGEAHARHYLAWARPFGEALAGRVSVVPGTVRHLWHGSVGDRRHGARHADLARFGFDPRADLGLDEGGCWRWTSDKPEMHRFVRDYFARRREDH